MKKQQKHLFTLVGLLMLASSQAQAADITVGTDGTCTLADAIRSANENVNWGECVGIGGYGDDTIYLETDVFLGSGEDERPPILSYENSSEKEYTGAVTIEGQGYVIDGNGEDGYVLKISTGPYDEVPCIGGDLTLNNATITGGNHAHPGPVMSGMLNNGGGITNACAGTVTLNNTTVSGNTALGNGGGIFNAPWADLILNNSTISDNIAEGNGGGGVYNDNGYVMLNNSTISDNIADGVGGGIDSVWLHGPWPSWTGSSVILNSSIISGNTAAIGNEIYQSGVPVYADNSNLFGHSGESDVEAFSGFAPEASDVNATSDGTSGILISTALSDILNPLADNGGLTLTHSLVKGSPAIDRDKECSTGLAEDQRGQSRPVGDGCDAGSFEFANHIPVADAGENQEEVVAGDLVCLDGSASSDVDGDPLTYSWELTAWPAGSTAELDDSTVEVPCFTADLSGTYQVSLVVNDGIENSEPSTTEVVAISLSEAVIATIEETVLVASSLDPEIFDNGNKQNALINQINDAIALIDDGLYAEALDKLENSILGKTDGCIESGEPDKNDWIEDCASQEVLYDLIQETISILEELM